MRPQQIARGFAGALGLGMAFALPAHSTVVFSEIEPLHEYRFMTDRTYVDEKGETHPLYEVRKPAKGNIYLHVTADVATPSAEGYRIDSLLLVDETNGDTRWETQPIASFDERGLVQESKVIGPAPKLQLDLLYEVPAARWEDAYLEVDGELFGPLGHALGPDATEAS